MEIALGVIIGLCFFIIPIWAYRKGINDGLKIRDSKLLDPIIKPLKMPFKQPKTEDDPIMQGLQNILAYDGTPQKEIKHD